MVVRRAAEHHRRAEVADGGVAHARRRRRWRPGRRPARRARGTRTSSPQMKNSSRGSPIRSTSSRVTSTPLNGITTSSSSPSRAARVDVGEVVHDPGAAGQPDREAPAGRGRPRRRRPGPRSRARRVVEQRGRGSRRSGSAVVVHQPDQVGVALDAPSASPSWKPPAPPVLRSRRAAPRPAPSARRRAGQPLAGAVGRGVVDDQTSSSPSICASSRATSRCSRPSRLKVTTTATMRGTDRVVTAHTLGHAATAPRSADRRRQQTCATRSSAWLAAYAAATGCRASRRCCAPERSLVAGPSSSAPPRSRRRGSALGLVDRRVDHRRGSCRCRGRRC